MLKIFLKFNDAVLKEIESDQDEITIGRNAKNDIQIYNMAVSRQHARIIKSLSRYYIEDLNSTNGTFVNKEKISSRSVTELKENDEITVCKHTLAIAFKKRGGQISDIKRTYMLETERHKEMLKNQSW
jgi:pSer/pThr/pTyr-binding forkhead associated (FHA) protein